MLREQRADDKLVIVGGVIPEEDAAELRAAGVDEIFTMGTATREIVAYIEAWMAEREAASPA